MDLRMSQRKLSSQKQLPRKEEVEDQIKRDHCRLRIRLDSLTGHIIGMILMKG